MGITIRPSRIRNINNYLLSGALLTGSIFLHTINPLLTIAGSILSLLPTIKSEVWRLSRKCVMHDTELIFEQGILRKNKKNILISNLYSVSVKQGLIERLFNYGTVTLGSWVDDNMVPTELFKIRRPEEVADHLNFLLKKNYSAHVEKSRKRQY